MRSLPSQLLSWAVVVALLLVFVGERLVAPASSHTVVTGVGLFALAFAIVVRFARVAGSDPGRRFVESRLLMLHGVAAVGVLLGLWLSNMTSVRDVPKLAVIVTALVPALIAASLLPTLLAELSYASMAKSANVERGRVRDALASGLAISFLIIFAFSAYYVASERDQKVDLSWFRAGKPGAATIQVVRGLEEPVTVITFFPPANEVGEAVKDYLATLQKESAQLKVEHSDVAMEPARARELGVSSNGAVLLKKEGRKETLLLGTEIESARRDLSRLDSEFNKRLLSVSKNKRVVYFTAGHSERGEQRTAGVDNRATVRVFKELVEAQNLTVKPLTAVEGLANEVPADAAAVFVLGPRKSLMPEEAGALSRYFDRGGRVLYALEPGTEVDTASLLNPLGLKLLPDVLANDLAFVKLSRQPSDHAILKTAYFSSHPSVTTLAEQGTRAPMGFWEAGALETLQEKPKDVSVEFTVHAHEATWNDANGDFVYDAGPEVRKKWELAAAVRKGQGRAIVVGDCDVFTDLLLNNDGNYDFALDGVKWLLGDEATAGEVNRDVDVPLQHTRGSESVWFYSTVFLAPALVIAFGFIQTRRRPKRAARKEARS